MSIFHKPDHIGAPLVLGVAALSLSLSLAFNPGLVFNTKAQPQQLTTAAELMRSTSMTPQQIEQARRDRCTPGFSCGATQPSYSRVSGKQALRFALAVSGSVTR